MTGQASRRDVVALLAGGVVALPSLARGQGRKPWRIGMLDTQPASMNKANLEAFQKGMRDLGYTGANSIVLEYRSADGRGEQFTELAAELVRLDVNVLVTRGTPAALAARAATRTTPIVMAAVGEPLMIVDNLVRPGGNITGLSALVSDLEAKRVEVLRDLVPGIRRIAGLYNMSNPIAPPQWAELGKTARMLGLEALLLDIRKPGDIAAAFAGAVEGRADSMIVGVDALTLAHRWQIVELAARHRLPAIYVSREYVEVGGLIAYGPAYADLYRRAAGYVHKILNGAKPGDLTIEQPTRFEMIVSLVAAKALGVEVPPAIMLRADEVIE